MLLRPRIVKGHRGKKEEKELLLNPRVSKRPYGGKTEKNEAFLKLKH